MVDVPTPVKVMPLQQNRYAPVMEFHNKMLAGLLSS
jgi:hypothetical protein